jgi:hypothetical protein
MVSRLTISSSLEHDGDGVVRYRIEACSPDFCGKTWTWGSETDAGELAKLLRGFPTSPSAKVEFDFGDASSGSSNLRFEMSNARGACRVWAVLSSEHVVAGPETYQSASVCIGFFPAALDVFCQQLGRFRPQRPNKAELLGMA